ncbi:deoxyribonuclease IV [Maridesulfovibrio hydrothermalis]|uniref:Probable endonuclease 4 n=1 Tax=Maridesulfovibrio hydrothermalis AM13 = DSM 14728 TaxID=1121451 RepID=L0RDY5_9BACT|nr:deoxyribonuclease IV [Maridesulfovibrio hydrothermalis]CCO23796.1 putative endonuclease 4 [Maridesulfovibrio hydrothermalis AM13 = DSM 14728]
MYIGAHMPITGGVDKAVERIISIGGTALQIFTRNQRQWKAKPLEEQVIERFKQLRQDWGGYPVSVHDSYLINLASPKPDGIAKSVKAFAQELRRTEALGIEYIVTHPGSHLGSGKVEALERYAANLDQAISDSETQEVRILIENTAGQGTNLGSRFGELATILENSGYTDRMGVCFDTCHAFAAGYDLRTVESCEEVFARFDKLVGLDFIRFFHLNDCKEGLGSNKDRHEHIGQGLIGLEGFKYIINDDRFSAVPKVIETPKGDDDFVFDKRNIELLRSLHDG